MIGRLTRRDSVEGGVGKKCASFFAPTLGLPVTRADEIMKFLPPSSPGRKASHGAFCGGQRGNVVGHLIESRLPHAAGAAAGLAAEGFVEVGLQLAGPIGGSVLGQNASAAAGADFA